MLVDRLNGSIDGVQARVVKNYTALTTVWYRGVDHLYQGLRVTKRGNCRPGLLKDSTALTTVLILCFLLSFLLCARLVDPGMFRNRRSGLVKDHTALTTGILYRSSFLTRIRSGAY